jgi:hypothetical protein
MLHLLLASRMQGQLVAGIPNILQVFVCLFLFLRGGPHCRAIFCNTLVVCGRDKRVGSSTRQTYVPFHGAIVCVVLGCVGKMGFVTLPSSFEFQQPVALIMHIFHVTAEPFPFGDQVNVVGCFCE